MLNVTGEKKDRTLYVKAEGRIDTKTSPQLEAELKALMQDVDEVVMDVAGIEYISSAGLRILLTTQKALAKKGALQIVHPTDAVLDIFDITGFDQVVTIVK